MATTPAQPHTGTPDEAVEMARKMGVTVHVNTMRRWCVSGHIRAWRIGPKRWRIDLDALQTQLLGTK